MATAMTPEATETPSKETLTFERAYQIAQEQDESEEKKGRTEWTEHGIVPTRRSVFTQIAAVMEDIAVVGVPKTRQAPQGRGKYRGIDDLQDALAAVMARHSLLILPGCVKVEWSERPSSKDGNLRFAVATCKFTFVDALTGDMWPTEMMGEAMDAGDRALQKAQTFAYKQLLIQVFCIPVEGQEGPHEARPSVDMTGSGKSHEEPRTMRPLQHSSPMGSQELRAQISAILGKNGKSDQEIAAWWERMTKNHGAQLESKLPGIYASMAQEKDDGARKTE